MAGFSDTLENTLLDLVFNAVSYAGQATAYTKLHTGDPGEAGTANAATETTRKATTFGAASSGQVATDADVGWTGVAGTETYSHISLWTASSGGTCIGSGALTASKAVIAGDSFTIPTGSLTFSLD